MVYHWLSHIGFRGRCLGLIFWDWSLWVLFVNWLYVSTHIMNFLIMLMILFVVTIFHKVNHKFFHIYIAITLIVWESKDKSANILLKLISLPASSLAITITCYNSLSFDIVFQNSGPLRRKAHKSRRWLNGKIPYMMSADFSKWMQTLVWKPIEYDMTFDWMADFIWNIPIVHPPEHCSDWSIYKSCPTL